MITVLVWLSDYVPSCPACARKGLTNVILEKLQQFVAANKLQRYYRPHTLPAVAARLAQSVNFDDLAAR